MDCRFTGKMSDCKIAEPQVKEIEIPVPWGTIKGKWWGPENRQPYLAVHGWQDNCGSFDALASLLAPEISLLCIDLPGHGLSSKMPAGMTYYIFWDTMVVIRRIVKHFNWPKVSIIGHSLGGASGFLYAGAYPDEVDKLISIDIVCPRIAKPEVLLKQVPDCIDKFLKYEGLPESSQPSYEYAEMVQIAMDAHNGSLTKQSCQTMMKRGMLRSSTNPKNFTFTRDPRLKVAGLAMFSKDQVYAYAGKIRCDYLNIRARPGIKFELPEVYGELMDKIKTTARKFEYREVAGTHHVHMNEGSREEVANVIREFINGKKSFSKTENGVGESGAGEVGENGVVEQ